MLGGAAEQRGVELLHPDVELFILSGLARSRRRGSPAGNEGAYRWLPVRSLSSSCLILLQEC
eukprot:6182283-Pleurochrysis_carterae.AAC.7